MDSTVSPNLLEKNEELELNLLSLTFKIQTWGIVTHNLVVNLATSAINLIWSSQPICGGFSSLALRHGNTAPESGKHLLKTNLKVHGRRKFLFFTCFLYQKVHLSCVLENRFEDSNIQWISSCTGLSWDFTKIYWILGLSKGRKTFIIGLTEQLPISHAIKFPFKSYILILLLCSFKECLLKKALTYSGEFNLVPWWQKLNYECIWTLVNIL